MPSAEVLFRRLEIEATNSNQRRLLVLSGDRNWCLEQVDFLLGADNLAWIGVPPTQAVQHYSNRQTHKLLGQTLGHLVYDAWSGLNPNSLGQVAGCIAGGHILVLLCPDLAQWPRFNDPENEQLVAHPYQPSDAGGRFITGFVRTLKADACACILRQQHKSTEPIWQTARLNTEQDTCLASLPSKTSDQQRAVELILSQFRRSRRPVVITADRGRGKSVALGIAAAQLSGLDYLDIVITAPEFSTVAAAFHMAKELLPQYDYSKGLLQHNQHRIRFLEPDVALSEAGEGQVLLVDEAGAIPVSTLTRLLSHFPRIAFSTTIHGYEGTGRGFAIRFEKILHTKAPQCKSVHLHQPIRWAVNDPLEQLLFKLLLLDAEMVCDDHLEVNLALDNLEIKCLNRDDLVANPAELEQLFGLLVLAHYRTTPSDLRILLDSPNISIWVLQSASLLLGVALVAEEGPLDPELVDGIWAGERRPKGHLLPQTLVNQEGCREAAQLKFGRIMRIAILPEYQRQRLGTRLISFMQKAMQDRGWDCLGASFAADVELIHFWQKAQFSLVRIGTRRDAVSGEHAALVLHGLSECGESLVTQLRNSFLEQLNFRLSDDLSRLEPNIACWLLHKAGLLQPLTDQDWMNLQGFAYHSKSYEGCAYAAQKFLIYVLNSVSDEWLSSLLRNSDFVLLLQRNLQRQSWEQLQVNGQGRRHLVTRLRSVIALLLEKFSPKA